MQKILLPPRADMPNWESYHGPWEHSDIQIVFSPQDFWLMTDLERIRVLQGMSATLAGSEAYSESIFAACPDLKIVARAGVGYDAIDLDAATQHGVWVTTTPGAPDHAVAEATWAMILALVRKLEFHLNIMRKGDWAWSLGSELCGKTLGVIGTGRIGKQVARIGRAFEMKLLGFDIRPDDSFAAAVGLRYVEMRELLTQTDFITIHTPRLPETLGLINADALSQMKPTAFLINTARGGIVDETALVAALRSQRLAGAALDVYEKEPLSANHPLRSLPNVVLTPHIASGTVETSRRIYLQALDNIVAVLDGKRPPNPVNEVREK